MRTFVLATANPHKSEEMRAVLSPLDVELLARPPDVVEVDETGETLEETALREVCEETGLTVRILSPLDAIKYTFVQRGLRIHKTVHYFMMEPTGGGLEDHDREFEEVRWISFAEAADLLSFETERSLVGLAATRLPEATA